MNEKIAVSVPEGLVRRVREEVREGRASSVSAYVSAAIDEKSRTDHLVRLLGEMDRTLGRPTAEDESWARGVLGL